MSFALATEVNESAIAVKPAKVILALFPSFI
jgi:hypothetical protein